MKTHGHRLLVAVSIGTGLGTALLLTQLDAFQLATILGVLLIIGLAVWAAVIMATTAATKPPSDDSKDWHCEGVVGDGQRITINGVNVWDHKWTATNHSDVTLPHPAHLKQLHNMTVYTIAANGETATFAAAELSNSVWGFYTPKRS